MEATEDTCLCSSFQEGRKPHLLRLAVCLCKPVGLPAWPLVPNPTFIVDLLYPTWQVESSSWLYSSIQEHFTVAQQMETFLDPLCILRSCGGKDIIYPFGLFCWGRHQVAFSERVWIPLSPPTALACVSGCLEDTLSITCTWQAGRTASTPGSELLLHFSRGKGSLSFLRLPFHPLLPASLSI